MLNMENAEDCEFLGECRMCLSNSISFICDTCASALRKNGIERLKNEGDYEWYKFNVDSHIQRKISKDICENSI